MSDKLNIANEMAVFDRKDRTFYDSLTDEERKKFSTFLMLRWGSSIQGSRELQEYYVQSTSRSNIVAPEEIEIIKNPSSNKTRNKSGEKKVYYVYD